MAIYYILVINRAGGLIFEYDCLPREADIELTVEYPIDLRVELIDNRPTVVFGEKGGVQVGHVVIECNRRTVGPAGRIEPENPNDTVDFLLPYLSSESNYPVLLKFGRPPLSTNEKIILSSMFHSFHAISAQLSPVENSGGISTLLSNTYRLQCFQTVTGCKFVAVSDTTAPPMDQLLHRLYELYADYALKNPFYSLDMPIRCDLFHRAVQQLVERFATKSTIHFI